MGSNHADRYNIWLQDLETIRRAQPVVDPNRFTQITVTVRAQPAPGQAAARSASRGDTTVTSASPDPSAVVVLSDDDDDQGNGPPQNMFAFYGQQGADTTTAMAMVRYQDHRLFDANKYPSRQNGLGFDMAQLRRDTGWANNVNSLQDVQPAWDRAMFMSEAPLGFDEAVSRNWTRDSFQSSLLRGFPMVRDVLFYRPGNYDGARSACFFKALSYCVYGDHTFYQRVQAEHLYHYSEILDWNDHPRHRLYKRMNQKYYDTIISAGQREVATVANFFQLLSIPNIWMPLDMLDVTADLYNLFIVVYTIRDTRSASSGSRLSRPEVTEVSTKGSYNARHIFLLFDGFHYQPMVPNEFLASEFTFPRVTYENTIGLPSSSVADQGKASVDLRWRNTWGPGLNRRKGHLPVDHVFYTQSLRIVMTGTYPSQ
ncbi:hypothetical protein J7T55_010212 [Diaporthe amygdali]|uniref:uncharacterized protein n=1 Tax=Phomopsis amygdali TaxID=1214568 RepID=UPI0022FE3131|nr:uncharacterized protein J7T55_010212 [Diaporthe amygdali]KAJ0113968.1 hypothetical protein J7T55_010212 [Diaporthe amygdali]